MSNPELSPEEEVLVKCVAVLAYKLTAHVVDLLEICYDVEKSEGGPPTSFKVGVNAVREALKQKTLEREIHAILAESELDK